MKEESKKLLARAEDNLLDAEDLLQTGRPIGVINRAYYAGFEAARAMLCEVGQTSIKTHGGLQSKYGELLVKTGKIDPDSGSWLRQLFQLRQTGDYEFDFEWSEVEIQKAIELARRFLAEARAFFAKSNAF